LDALGPRDATIHAFGRTSVTSGEATPEDIIEHVHAIAISN